MKASILFGEGWENDSVEVLWREPGRLFCRLWRNDAEGEKHAFVPIFSEAGHPTVETVNRLAHEFELREQLNGISALRPLEFVRDRGQTMLVRGAAARSPDPPAHGNRSISPVRSFSFRGSP